jgi:isoleucyl-tRNA synthetase
MQQLLAMREAVSKVLEPMRAEGRIGAALQAEVTVFADGIDLAAMPGLQDELRFLFITSSLAVQPVSSAGSDAIAVEGTPFKVLANVSKHGKCVRCWHYVESVGQDAHDPELCGRCIENVNGGGEVRRYF